LKRAFTAEKIDYVLNTLNKPIFITECGANIEKTGQEANYELQAFENELKIFNEWGINWIVHWFRDIGIFKLHNGAPNYTPTKSGQITQQYLKEQKTFSPTTQTPTTTTQTPTPTTSTPTDSTPTTDPTQTPTSTTATNPTPTTTPTQFDIPVIFKPFHYWRTWKTYYFPTEVNKWHTYSF
ncbi:MAG: hypothetical protein FWG55_03510, partial [Candidatus Bathyarchaeota archaeon]|nr:hypothetical protein [Candidatus Termiticorpusculum sp.]